VDYVVLAGDTNLRSVGVIGAVGFFSSLFVSRQAKGSTQSPVQ